MYCRWMLKWSERRRVGPTKYTYTVASLRCRRRRSAGRTDGYKKKGKKGGRAVSPRVSARERGIELRAGKFQAAKEAGGAKRAALALAAMNSEKRRPKLPSNWQRTPPPHHFLLVSHEARPSSSLPNSESESGEGRMWGLNRQ